jgi:uncharacterized protein (DUF488 family)
VLFTTGYARHSTPGDLLAALRAAGVKRIVDVRDRPASRRRGFSKRALSEALAEGGIAYVHVRALGNPKPFRDLYRAGAQEAGEAAYRAHVRASAAAQAELDALAASLPERATCLLCLEEDAAHCHRIVVAGELCARLPGLDVVHL